MVIGTVTLVAKAGRKGATENARTKAIPTNRIGFPFFRVYLLSCQLLGVVI